MSNNPKTDFKNGNTVTEGVLSTIRKTAGRHHMIESGDCVLVALSGGADSVCLLDALCKLRETLKIKVAAAHLNHMIRGVEADSDEAYAAELCTRLGVPFYAERVNVPKLAEERGISEELAGRYARYDFFEKICSTGGYNKVATAHNKNDRAETVLMRVLRGTGIDGLCSIKYTRDNIIRPLLDVERADIEGYCRENSLDFCTDSTNLASEYTRNKVRNELLPMLEKSFNPSIIDSLCTLADNSAEDSEFLNGYASRLYARINSPMPKRKPTVLDIKSLKMVGESIQTRLLRIAISEVMGSDYKAERTHIEAIRGLLDKETGASATLPKNLTVSVKYGWLEFVKRADNQEECEDKPFCFEIEVEDEERLEAYDITFEVTNEISKPQKNQMIIDYDALCGRRLFVRNRRDGDRINIFKDGKTRKLKNYWIDKKVPREERGRIPLLCTEDEVIAIIGDRVAEKYKITDSTKRGLVITYGADYENR